MSWSSSSSTSICSMPSPLQTVSAACMVQSPANTVRRLNSRRSWSGRIAAGCQDAQLATGAEHTLDQGGAGCHEVLAVIQDEQQGTGFEGVGEPAEHGLSRRLGHV